MLPLHSLLTAKTSNTTFIIDTFRGLFVEGAITTAVLTIISRISRTIRKIIDTSISIIIWDAGCLARLGLTRFGRWRKSQNLPQRSILNYPQAGHIALPIAQVCIGSSLVITLLISKPLKWVSLMVSHRLNVNWYYSTIFILYFPIISSTTSWISLHSVRGMSMSAHFPYLLGNIRMRTYW